MPDLWVRALATEAAAVPTYHLPPDPALSWGMDRVSAGFAWGQGVTGRSRTRVCLIGMLGWGVARAGGRRHAAAAAHSAVPLTAGR